MTFGSSHLKWIAKPNLAQSCEKDNNPAHHWHGHQQSEILAEHPHQVQRYTIWKGQLQCELWAWDSVRTRGSLAVRFAREMSLMLSVLRYEQARVWMLAWSVVEICAWWLNMHSFTLAGMSVTHFPTTWSVHPQQKQTPSHPFEFPQSKSSNFGLEPPPPLPWWPPLWAYSRDSSLITESVGAEKEGYMVVMKQAKISR